MSPKAVRNILDVKEGLLGFANDSEGMFPVGITYDDTHRGRTGKTLQPLVDDAMQRLEELNAR